MPFDLSLSESAGSSSLDRLVMRPHGMRSRVSPLVLNARLSAEVAQGRLVPDQPDVPERVGEPTLPVRPPGRDVVFNVIARCARLDGACHHLIRFVDEQFHPYSRRTNLLRTVETVLYRLVQEERCAVNFQASD